MPPRADITVVTQNPLGKHEGMRPFKTNFSLLERDLIARAAGRVFDAAQIDSSRPDNARTAATRPPGYPRRPQQQDRAPGAPAAARGVEAREIGAPPGSLRDVFSYRPQSS